MTLVTKFLGGAVLTAAIAGTSFAASHLDPAVAGAISARKAHMQLYQHNAGTLFAMAQGKVDYDADSASAAASNLATLATLKQQGYWIPGTDQETLGEDTRALAAIWADGSDIGAKADAFVEASAAMNAVAGDGLDALKGAIGAVGGACNECHKSFRGSR